MKCHLGIAVIVGVSLLYECAPAVDEFQFEPTPTTLMPKAEIRYTGGDGSSTGEAVAIEGACGTHIGILAQSLRSEGKRKYDVIEFEVKRKEIVTNYFDITGFYGNDLAGAWELTKPDGIVIKGTICDWDRPVPMAGRKGPWNKAVSNATGVLMYQIEIGVGQGHVAYGPLHQGAYDGVWKFFGHEGWQEHVSYSNDVLHGRRVKWYPDGKKESEEVYDGGVPRMFSRWSQAGDWSVTDYNLQVCTHWYEDQSLMGKEEHVVTNGTEFTRSRRWDRAGHIVSDGLLTDKGWKRWTGTFVDFVREPETGVLRAKHRMHYVDGKMIRRETLSEQTTAQPEN